jgi:hypothetical protein
MIKFPAIATTPDKPDTLSVILRNGRMYIACYIPYTPIRGRPLL